MKEYSAFSPGQHEIDLNQAIVAHEKLVRWVVGRQGWEGLAWADVLRYVPYHGAGGPDWVVAGVAAV